MMVINPEINLSEILENSDWWKDEIGWAQIWKAGQG